MTDIIRRRLSSFPKAPKPLRSEPYRRLVASLPCIACGVVGRSNHAHSNTGKAKAMKNDDRDAFPLCVDQPGKVGCHTMHDQRRMFKGATDDFYRNVERGWISRTKRILRTKALYDPAIRKIVDKTIGMEAA